jgi:hypothetical protein
VVYFEYAVNFLGATFLVPLVSHFLWWHVFSDYFIVPQVVILEFMMQCRVGDSIKK